MAGPGRPSSFKSEYVAQAEKLCKLGATDNDIAQFFGVNVVTIWRWKDAHPEFCNALKRGKEVADDLVEQSLFRRATGYSHDAVKIFQVNGEALSVPYVEHHAPDTTAAIFWLKNRRPADWRDKQVQEHTGPDGEHLKPTIILTGRPETPPAS